MLRCRPHSYQALETGTRLPAVHLGQPEDWGTIAVGRVADMMLFERNPLVGIGNIGTPAGVVLRGRWIPQTEIRRRLDEIAAEVHP